MSEQLASIYSSPAGEQALKRHYDETLASLPYAVESLTVHTRFGNAHVLIAGPKDGSPLMLWQGKSKARTGHRPYWIGFLGREVDTGKVTEIDVMKSRELCSNILMY